MAGAILNRQLTASKNVVQFAVAEQKHDAEIRHLLRDNPTRGSISLSFTREPDYFIDAQGHLGDKQTIVATRGEKVICVGSCLNRTCFINGQPRNVGYLGGLRLDAGVSGQFSILRQGYEFFRELQSHAPADFYFTSIASDNVRARHFLEAEISGMPKYEFIAEYITLVLPTSIRASGADGDTARSTEFVDFINQHNSQFQFAPVWTEPDLAALQKFGLDSHCGSIRNGNELTACANIWDQRSFKQTVIHDYSRSLNIVRPFVNLFSPLLRQPRLPAVGSTLSHAYISCVAWKDTHSLLALLGNLSAAAAQKGIEFLMLGLAASNRATNVLIGRLKCRQYRSRIYILRWPDCGGGVDELDKRPIGPEAALL